MTIDADSGRTVSEERSKTAALEFTKGELEMLPGVFAELGVEVDYSDAGHMEAIAKRVRSLFERRSDDSAYLLGAIATKMDAARGSDPSANAWPVAVPAENVKRSVAAMTSSDQRLLDMTPDTHVVRTANEHVTPDASRRVACTG